ncbi:MAG TPA: HesA/MoeB/ThiF family protein [Thermodesulfovibrionales bacterium]|nr:HesA/MoeB/ThiF family protein [Thermodesulfovibrionales bacterium]
MIFSEEELKRYHRQMLIDHWGETAQEKLKNSTVFIAGAGGLGSPVAIYLAVAGIGNIRICDFDNLDWTNLNRQILHDHTRIGTNKAVSGKHTIEKMNPHVKVRALLETIVAENVDELVGDADIIVDCMDNFPTRYLLNESAIRKNIPLVYGSIKGMDGMLSFIQSPETPCLRCLFPEAPPGEVFPVLGATPGVIGSLQTIETIKYLTGIGTNIKEKLLVWDGGKTEFRIFKAQKDPDCPTCGDKKKK